MIIWTHIGESSIKGFELLGFPTSNDPEDPSYKEPVSLGVYVYDIAPLSWPLRQTGLINHHP